MGAKTFEQQTTRELVIEFYKWLQQRTEKNEQIKKERG